MLRVTEDLCDTMTKYNTRPKLPFRYKRGGMCRGEPRSDDKRKSLKIFFHFFSEEC